MPTVPMLRTSERATFLRCPQRWWWAYREGLVPDGPPATALWFGIGIHEALAGYYLPGRKRGPHPAATWKKYVKDELVWIRAGSYDDSEYLDARELGIGMLEGYVELYGEDKQWDVLSPEYIAVVDIPDKHGKVRVRYLVTCDGVVKNLDTGLYEIPEHKTAAQISIGHLSMDRQVGSYLPIMEARLRADGLLSDREHISTVEYNILRKDLPREDDRPVNEDGLRLNKNGTVSKRQALQADLFRRVPVERGRAARERQIQSILDDVRWMNAVRNGSLPVLKNVTRGCGGGMGESKCPFFEMCDLHEQGGDWETLRNATMKVQDPYANYRKSA